MRDKVKAAEGNKRRNADPAVRARKAAYHKEWSAKNKDKLKIYNLRWYAANKHKTRNYHLSTYGLTSVAYEAMLAAQGGGCAVCRSADPQEDGGRTAFHVDHNHATGAVRGLLCKPCNLALGYAKDDPHRLRLLAGYLERYAGFDHAVPA